MVLSVGAVEILEIGIALLVIVILYFLRDYVEELISFILGHKKIFVAFVVIIVVLYLVLSYKPPPAPPPPPNFVRYNVSYR